VALLQAQSVLLQELAGVQSRKEAAARERKRLERAGI
jgi:hypothetical protein